MELFFEDSGYRLGIYGHPFCDLDLLVLDIVALIMSKFHQFDRVQGSIPSVFSDHSRYQESTHHFGPEILPIRPDWAAIRILLAKALPRA